MKQSPIAVVGLSHLFRECLQRLLPPSRFLVVASASRLEAVTAGFGSVRPDLVICCVAANEDALARIAELRTYRAELAGIGVVLLVDDPSGDILREAANAGARAVLSKDITGDILQRSLELAALGQQLFPGMPEVRRPASPASRPPATLRTVPSHPDAGPGPASPPATPALRGPALRGPALSACERHILRLLAGGATNKTIASDLQISEAKVKVHMKGLLRKIRVTNRTQAAVWSMNNAPSLTDETVPMPPDLPATTPARQALPG